MSEDRYRAGLVYESNYSKARARCIIVTPDGNGVFVAEHESNMYSEGEEFFAHPGVLIRYHPNPRHVVYRNKQGMLGVTCDMFTDEELFNRFFPGCKFIGFINSRDDILNLVAKDSTKEQL